jgi:hypothetical protein
MTEQEIYDSYEFKLVKKILKKEFKWIKDVKLDGDPDKYKSLIFLEVSIDPFECAEEEGLTVAHYIRKNVPEDIGHLGTYFKESMGNPLIKNIEDEMENVCKNIKTNPAIPQELKLKRDSRFDVNRYIYLG